MCPQKVCQFQTKTALSLMSWASLELTGIDIFCFYLSSLLNLFIKNIYKVKKNIYSLFVDQLIKATLCINIKLD